MLKNALNYIKSTLIEEKIIKHPDRPEADRFFNYPFEALEEALVNAVYHRSYDIREPIEVRILPDCITVCSYAGPDRSIKLTDLKSGSFVSRRYRNRRIGEFLKELEMTEGRGTGIPKIILTVKNNQSPMPVFDSDEERTFFSVEFLLHPSFKDETLNETLNESKKEQNETLNETLKLTNIQQMIVSLIKQNPKISHEDLVTHCNKSRATVARHLKILREAGVIKRQGSKKDGHWEVQK